MRQLAPHRAALRARKGGDWRQTRRMPRRARRGAAEDHAAEAAGPSSEAAAEDASLLAPRDESGGAETPPPDGAVGGGIGGIGASGKLARQKRFRDRDSAFLSTAREVLGPEFATCSRFNVRKALLHAAPPPSPCCASPPPKSCEGPPAFPLDLCPSPS